MPPEQPFRFLDLPKDVRLMIYECLDLQVIHKVHEFPDRSSNQPAQTYVIKEVHMTMQGLQILTACKQIRQEASATLKQSLARSKACRYRLLVQIPVLHCNKLIDDFLTNISWTHDLESQQCENQLYEHARSRAAFFRGETDIMPAPLADPVPRRKVEIAIETLGINEYYYLKQQLMSYCTSLSYPSELLSGNQVALRVDLRLVRTSSQHSQELDPATEYEFRQELARKSQSTTSKIFGIGEDIDADEWANFWADSREEYERATSHEDTMDSGRMMAFERPFYPPNTINR